MYCQGTLIISFFIEKQHLNVIAYTIFLFKVYTVVYTLIMKINEVSKITGISKRNIHFYIKEKLLTPSINKENGYYEFNEIDCKKLSLIYEFRNAGLPISMIRSILKEPSTSSFYLSQYKNELNQKKQHLEKTMQSMNYIIEHLPLHITFNNLYSTVQKSEIPIYRHNETLDVDSKDAYLINRFLWSRFILEDIQNDYHEFLWSKINKLVSDDPSDDYRKIIIYLKSLSPSEIENLYKDNSSHFEWIVSLDEKGCKFYSEQLIKAIDNKLDDVTVIHYWKKNYDNFFLPNIRLYDSPIFQNIIIQISPFFEQYTKNIHKICLYLYNYLTSKEGFHLLQKMNSILGEYCDIENYHHAFFEAFCFFILPENKKVHS